MKKRTFRAAAELGKSDPISVFEVKGSVSGVNDTVSLINF